MEFVSAAGSFACEVNGSALWETQASGDALKIREAFQEHGVLVFRRQSLSERELLEFGRMIGSSSLGERRSRFGMLAPLPALQTCIAPTFFVNFGHPGASWGYLFLTICGSFGF